jgi:hypothetical protein
MSNRVRIIGLCAVFNIRFEYSARGITEFSHRPLFFLALFGIYLTFFAMVEDLIVRYRLKNYQIMMVAFLYGFVPEMFLTGNLFNEATSYGFFFLGISVKTIVIVNFFAWGIMQSLVTLYFANRIQVRDWEHPRMGKVGWGLCIFYQVLVIVIARSNPYRPRGTPIAYVIAVSLMIVVAILIIRSLSEKGETWQFQPSFVMDVCAFGSVVLFIILGTFVQGPQVITSQPLHRTAVVIEVVWTVAVGIVFLVYQRYKGSDVTV